MEIRPVSLNDLIRVGDIDGTIESTRYLHLDRAGEGLAVTFKLEERPLREKIIQPNRFEDEHTFALKQIVGGADEGIALLAEHEEEIVAAALAQPRAALRTMQILDLRVDYDYRRQGLATAMVFQIIQSAREMELRAVATESKTNNLPAAQFFAKCGFDLAGIDSHRDSNHDLVKESATLLWYAALD
jgi:GNAT superfamily N-acetyltransferase